MAPPNHAFGLFGILGLIFFVKKNLEAQEKKKEADIIKHICLKHRAQEYLFLS